MHLDIHAVDVSALRVSVLQPALKRDVVDLGHGDLERWRHSLEGIHLDIRTLPPEDLIA